MNIFLTYFPGVPKIKMTRKHTHENVIYPLNSGGSSCYQCVQWHGPFTPHGHLAPTYPNALRGPFMILFAKCFICGYHDEPEVKILCLTLLLNKILRRNYPWRIHWYHLYAMLRPQLSGYNTVSMFSRGSSFKELSDIYVLIPLGGHSIYC